MAIDVQAGVKAPAVSSRTSEAFPMMVERNRVANGGWEYWLVIDGERVGGGLGIFTEPGVKPHEAFPKLVARAMRQDERED